MEAKEFLKYSNWVVCGNVTDEGKFAYKILSALKNEKYSAVGYHPLAKEGTGVYNSLNDVPFKIQVLDLCINPERGLMVVKEAKKYGINNVLAQPGARSEELKKYCQDNDINYIEGCALVELAKL